MLNKKKKYIIIIPLLFMLIVFVLPFLIKMYKVKMNSTNFNFRYEVIKIGDYNSNSDYYKKIISFPTVKNDVEKLLNNFSVSLDGYYVLYLVITQYDEVPNKKLNIVFNKYGKYDKDNLSKQIPDSSQIVNEEVNVYLSKDESLKVPIGICKTTIGDPFITDCIYIRYEPLSITYKNKYLFSKKTNKIPKLEESNLYINGNKDKNS